MSLINRGVRDCRLSVFFGSIVLVVELKEWRDANYEEQKAEHHDEAEDGKAFAQPLALVVLFDPIP